MRLPFRRAAVFTGLARPRLGEEAKTRSKLYPSGRGLVSVLAHGGVAYVNDGRGHAEVPAMDLRGVLEGSRLGQEES